MILLPLLKQGEKCKQSSYCLSYLKFYIALPKRKQKDFVFNAVHFRALLEMSWIFRPAFYGYDLSRKTKLKFSLFLFPNEGRLYTSMFGILMLSESERDPREHRTSTNLGLHTQNALFCPHSCNTSSAENLSVEFIFTIWAIIYWL